MTHLHRRLRRLEAQAWEVKGRRLAQMTEAALDAEIVRVEAHYLRVRVNENRFLTIEERVWQRSPPVSSSMP